MLKTLEDVSEILGINANELPGPQKDKRVLIVWTNDLIKKMGWIGLRKTGYDFCIAGR